MPRRSEAAIQRDRDESRKRRNLNKDQANKTSRAWKQREMETRPFIGWDSEGYDAFAVDSSGVCQKLPQRTMLFGCSEPGQYITGMNLGTVEMLGLIIQVAMEHPRAIHVGFAFEYDVNQILQDLPWRTLNALKRFGACKYKGFRIKHVPHKVFEVSYRVSNSQIVRATIYDVFGYFHSKYTTALAKYNIGDDKTLRTIAEGKSKRGSFTYAELEYVVRYWKAEISLFPPLMDAVRTAAYGGGFRVHKWHGPGALASYALAHNGVREYMSKGRFPKKVSEAIRYAYCGGRFQSWYCGYYDGDVYTLDKNSAYVQAIAELPRLDNGRWEEIDPSSIKSDEDIARFGIYYIHFDATKGREQDRLMRGKGYPSRPYPLFHRDKNGRLTWPNSTLGWYWSPEARLVAGSASARFVRAFVYRDDGTYPFAFVNRYYDNRVILQELGNPAEKAFKWSLAAMYGQFAQRVGWNRDTHMPPSSHELAWAGYITSHCRAAIFDVAQYAYYKGGLISVDTDGVTASVEFPQSLVPEGFGTGLGQWKQTHYTGILHWQNGIYWLRNENCARKECPNYKQPAVKCGHEWDEAKSRGVPKGRISRDDADDTLKRGHLGDMRGIPKLVVKKSRYIGYRQALMGQFDKWRVWEESTENIYFGGSPDSKGWHVPVRCNACRNETDAMHTIMHMLPTQLESVPHRLPWLVPPPIDTDIGMIYRDMDTDDTTEFEYGSDVFATSADIFNEDDLEDRL